MLRRLSVRGKILASLAVPVLVLFFAAAFISAQAANEARAAQQTSSLVDAFAVQDATGRVLAQERAYAILAEYGVDGADQGMTEARAATDAALAELTAAYEGLNVSALSPRIQTAIDDTLAARSDLASLRTDIDRGEIGGEIELTLQYSALIDTALDVPRALSDTTSDRELAQYIDAYVLTDELMAQVTLERPVAGAMLQSASAHAQDPSAPAPTPRDTLRVAAIVQQGTTLADEARRELRRLPSIQTKIPSPEGVYLQLRTLLAGSSPESAVPSDVAQWDELSQADLDSIAPVRDEVRGTTATLASDRAGDAMTEMIVTIAVTVLAVVASVLVAVSIARGIVRPLRRLTDAAQGVRDQLPVLVEQVVVPGQGPKVAFTPITVESSDEVGQLAAAFNDVNATTLTVAREQAALRGSIAEMFVNVARRDQVLLNRQLAFLDDLERTEQDPNALSNLFRLDHLATRMRRNAESLLVLAGIDSGRRVRQPMPASDVIRTASSEIELYDRVRLNLVVDPSILGHNALTAAHLLAELLENATMFSEPHTPVEVTTGYDGQNVQFTIRDHGLGMTPEELAEANRRVETYTASEVVGAQRLGLYVVGRLANRLGAKVTFALGPNGAGTDVTVNLPIGLFAPEAGMPLPRSIDPMEITGGRDATPFVSEPAPVVEAAPPATVPVFGGSATQPVEEAPIAVPVDIEALTDGTTTSGMPRRRSRGVDAAAAAPSVSLAQGPQTGAIVLPPLATPSLPLDIPATDDSWTPPDDVTVPGAALPSRQRAAGTTAATDEPEETPILDVGARTALFSSFRTMGDLDTSVGMPAVNPVELEPAPEVTATDISVPDFDAAPATEAWSPQFAIDEESAQGLASRDTDTSAMSAMPSDLFAESVSTTSRESGDDAPGAYVPGTYQPEAYEPETYQPEAYEPAAQRATERSWLDSDETQIVEPVRSSDDWVGALTDETIVRAPGFDLPAADAFRAESPGAPDVGVPDAPVARSFDKPPAPDVAAFDPSALIDEATAFPSPPPSTSYDADRGTESERYAAQSGPYAPEGERYAPDGEAHPVPDVWSATQPVSVVEPTPEAQVPPAAIVPAPPVVGEPGPGAQEEIPEELTFEALPRFEELMADLPTRRSMREAAPGKRGLFGRRTRPDAPGATPGQAPSGPAAAGRPNAYQAPASAPEGPGYQPVGYPADAARGDLDQFAPPAYGVPQDSDFDATTALDAAPGVEPAPGVESAPAAERQDPYGFDGHGAGSAGSADGYATGSYAAPAPFAPPPAAPGFDSAYGQATAASAAHESAYGTPNLGGYGPPTPLIRRRANESFESLDSEYTADSVEARSDWMASAVLYEEMSSLLRSNEFGDETLAEAPGGYQPLRMETGTPGLTRRARGDDRDGYVDRFTARIERDPEQLRARLAAFQSATARGRAEAEEETEAAWGGSSADYVPDSAPRAR